MSSTTQFLFQTYLVNNSFKDPVLYLNFLFEKQALLFDPGKVRALPARKLLRISHLFVSHTHIDHLAGLDWLPGICPGRCKHLHLFGPAGVIDSVAHKPGVADQPADSPLPQDKPCLR